ncbi:MAG: DNA-methyltransferase [Solirubrobacterales bacterium]
MSDRLQIIVGDCLDSLLTLPAGSVKCCVTSPPYWGLRDYGVAGQIGQEESPAAFVETMRKVFVEVWRVLADDGTLWLNLGDSYASGGRGSYDHDEKLPQRENSRRPDSGLKPKDLCGMPWRVAFALQADGWYLRQDIIWHKPNPMPESVTDRCTKSHEYLFLLTKSERYYFDAEAINEPSICGDPRKPYAPGQVDSRGSGHDRNGGKIRPSVARGGIAEKTTEPGKEAFRSVKDWRNKRSVWTITTAAFKEAHFATFPPDLVKPCILAGSATGDTILDPFGGSGTTGMVALELGRKAILLELNPEYAELARQRCHVTPGLAL